jgi:hypothetical protein
MDTLPAFAADDYPPAQLQQKTGFQKIKSHLPLGKKPNHHPTIFRYKTHVERFLDKK